MQLQFMWMEKQVELVTARVNKLKDYLAQGIMETKSGNELFSSQLDLGIRYFENYLGQLNMTKIPYIN